ncbi:hypothetical protein PTKIN_Ptkin06aG0168200 [Pterospermum kingtungense]
MAEKKELAAAGEEMELKKELQKVVEMILEEDDYGIEMTIEAIRILSCSAELKLKKPTGLGMDGMNLPEKFKCPLSGEIMGDPVILSSGQTYDRPYIQKWLNDVVQRPWNRTPKGSSGHIWSLVTKADRIYLNSLLAKLRSSLSDQKEAAKELRRLTKTTPSYREIFCERTNTISILLSPLSESERNIESEPDLQEDLITIVLNLSIPENNKKLVAENPIVLPLLIESMKFGTLETRRNAAAAIFTLSALDSNKVLIGNSGALLPLLELLHEGHPLAMKDAASAIFCLCFRTDNNAKFNQLGAVKVVLENINDGILVDELLDILVLLSADHNAIDEIGDLDTLLNLLKIIRHSSLERTKENCVEILYNVCKKNLTLLMVIRVEEIKRHTLAELAETGTSRARRKASRILRKINKSFSTNAYNWRK